MVDAILLVGLRRGEVLGLTLGDIHVGERRGFVVAGSGRIDGTRRWPNRFFTSVGHDRAGERPAPDSDRVFVVVER